MNITACQKEVRYETASDKLANKVWYLEKRVSNSASYMYVGSPTFSFKLESSTFSYLDSDGIVGEYSIVEKPQEIWMHIISPTRIIDSYKIGLLESDHFIAEFHKNNELQVLYFSTRP